mgnify:CR=1 FL=1
MKKIENFLIITACLVVLTYTIALKFHLFVGGEWLTLTRLKWAAIIVGSFTAFVLLDSYIRRKEEKSANKEGSNQSLEADD